VRQTYRTLTALTRCLVELTGFEPVTPSLRKMGSARSDQGKQRPSADLWGGSGASHVRQGEMP
jgi:hypothetical protein